MRLALFVALLLAIVRSAAAAPGVILTRRDDGGVVLANGLVSATLAPRSGNLLSFRLGERELLSEPAYLDWQDGKQRRLSAASLDVRADPANSPDGRAEIVFHQPWSRAERDVALDVSLHYVLLPGESALRMFVVYRHPTDYPAAGFGQSRYVLRARDDVFDTISVDEARTHALPPGDTPVEVLGPKESMRFTAGPAKGEITDKYHYFVSSGGHFFHGWMGSESRLGLWLVYGSTEDQNGGPARQHNTAHWPRMLLKILSCGHYGAPAVAVPAGETWEKIYGPWALYANAAAAVPGPDILTTLRADASRQADAERVAFPPAWLDDSAFPAAAARGSVAGRLVVADPQAPRQTAAGAWVGLVAPPPAPDWQQQALGYQPWTRADADGRFTLPAVRAGRHELRAFAPGVLDEFVRADVEVRAGQALDLGALDWRPVRRGRELWQIGTPDRSAAEFLHGDEPRRWGRWLDYARDFPRDVSFTVGESDPRTEWNFAQGTRPGPDGKTWIGTTWRVHFSIDDPALAQAVAPATLRLAFAASHNARLRVRLDDHDLGEATGLGSDNALARAGVHGQYSTCDIPVPAALLTPGRHTLYLDQRAGGAPFKNVMYDCIRLEAPPEATSAK